MSCDRLGMILHTVLSVATLAAVTFLAATHVIGSDATMVVVVGVAGISGVTISRADHVAAPMLPPGSTIVTPPMTTTVEVKAPTP